MQYGHEQEDTSSRAWLNVAGPHRSIEWSQKDKVYDSKDVNARPENKLVHSPHDRNLLSAQFILVRLLGWIEMRFSANIRSST